MGLKMTSRFVGHGEASWMIRTGTNPSFRNLGKFGPLAKSKIIADKIVDG
jgi:hypothetical protein